MIAAPASLMRVDNCITDHPLTEFALHWEMQQDFLLRELCSGESILDMVCAMKALLPLPCRYMVSVKLVPSSVRAWCSQLSYSFCRSRCEAEMSCHNRTGSGKESGGERLQEGTESLQDFVGRVCTEQQVSDD